MKPVIELPIAEFCDRVFQVPADQRGKWATNLAEALRDNDPSRSEYASKLIQRRDA